MKKAKVTKKEGKALKKWLEASDPIGGCPFNNGTIDCSGWSKESLYCLKFFPKLGAYGIGFSSGKVCYPCPCHTFDIKYVKRVARELIKEVSKND